MNTQIRGVIAILAMAALTAVGIVKSGARTDDDAPSTEAAQGQLAPAPPGTPGAVQQKEGGGKRHQQKGGGSSQQLEAGGAGQQRGTGRQQGGGGAAQQSGAGGAGRQQGGGGGGLSALKGFANLLWLAFLWSVIEGPDER
jgi:hypothetical protein